MNRTNIENQARQLLKSKSWKKFLVLGVVLLILDALLSSVLFDLILALLRVGFALGGFIALGYALYLAWPEIVKRYKEETRKS